MVKGSLQQMNRFASFFTQFFQKAQVLSDNESYLDKQLAQCSVVDGPNHGQTQESW